MQHGLIGFDFYPIFTVVLGCHVYLPKYLYYTEWMKKRCSPHKISRKLWNCSTEKLNHGDYKLLKSARYSHSENYIIKLLDKYSFKIIDKKDAMIRKHKSASVIGQIYLTEYIV